jgi:SAM-dependent methyltransferase
MEAAKKAKRVFAVDAYTSVVAFAQKQLQATHTTNVHYIVGDREHLPLADNSVEVAINAWAELNPREAYRVLKPQGYLIQLGADPNALCGELTAELAPEYAWIPRNYAPAEVYKPDYPDTYSTADTSIWNGIPVTGPIHTHQFTYVADYGDYIEAASIVGRMYGTTAKRYFLARKQCTYSWRLQIIMGQVSK